MTDETVEYTDIEKQKLSHLGQKIAGTAMALCEGDLNMSVSLLVHSLGLLARYAIDECGAEEADCYGKLMAGLQREFDHLARMARQHAADEIGQTAGEA